MNRIGKNERTWATIPPYFPDMLIGVFFLYVGISMLPQSFWELNIPELIFIVAGIFHLAGSSVHCTILPKGLLVQFLWIPFRFIRWDKVGNAEYMTRWFHGNGYRYGKGYIGRKFIWKDSDKPAWIMGSGIFITTLGCPGFFAELDSMLLFRLKHPVGAMFFRFLPFRCDGYVRLFQRYFPKLVLPVEMLISQQNKNSS